ncbi:hypothetical protein JCM31447_11720 [Fluviispira sanaruensis]|uniref:Uncharacterized protein n=1 Tax=Fluviispira sanaruensis TaxID=2493639 RepID=A0A4P2VLQ0_FLUSA|nr:hypothetical protein JCM31447_11720 [Fluviispira sanaruensis]
MTIFSFSLLAMAIPEKKLEKSIETKAPFSILRVIFIRCLQKVGWIAQNKTMQKLQSEFEYIENENYYQ